ncbi:MAG TPA: NAD(P)-dependent oxidoreductase, partial [Paenibacillus sp.]|nr:NAD(P)-dependent oxidoreductase [Paenibacillus sp.]
MRTIGFIGLGTMGAPMALNLLNKGYEVVLYNRTRDRAESVAAGRPAAEVVSSPKEVARESDVVITMLGDDASVEAVYYGANGIFGALRAGMTVIDCSTVSPELSRRIAADAEEHLADFLDAPVTGSKPAAESGTLLFMVGGREETLDSVRDVLAAMGRGVVHMGPSGAGSQTKLAHNAIVGINGAAVAEGLALAVKAGVDPAKFLDVVGSGGAASRFLELKRDKLLQGDYSNQFSLKFMLKDLRLASAFADELQVPTPVLSATKELFQIGEARGLGELDFSSIAQCFEEWTRASVR